MLAKCDGCGVSEEPGGTLVNVEGPLKKQKRCLLVGLLLRCKVEVGG